MDKIEKIGTTIIGCFYAFAGAASWFMVTSFLEYSYIVNSYKESCQVAIGFSFFLILMLICYYQVFWAFVKLATDIKKKKMT